MVDDRPSRAPGRLGAGRRPAGARPPAGTAPSARCGTAGPAVSEAAELLALAFGADEITGTRHAVAAGAAAVGLAGQRLEGFVLAVNEVVTNAVRHGGGRGRLRLWHGRDAVWCEVRDGGGSGRPDLLDGYRLPPSSATGGRGLWLARHLCDEVDLRTGEDGTTVRLGMQL